MLHQINNISIIKVCVTCITVRNDFGILSKIHFPMKLKRLLEKRRFSFYFLEKCILKRTLIMF